jgi:hypothetical protein
MVMISSGRRFNITTGFDTNRDAQFTERPTFAQLLARCQDPLRPLSNSFCDVGDVSDMNAVIPRNYGEGPGTVMFNLNLSKTFGFGGGGAATAAAATQTEDRAAGGGQGGGQRVRMGGAGGGGPRGGGGRGGMGGFFGGGTDARKPYNLTLGINAQNVFNIVNQGNPVGSMTSPDFGRSRSNSGGFGFFGGGGSANRRIDLQVRFSW